MTVHVTAIESLDDDEKGVCTVYTPGGPQSVSTISESGLYSLVMRSRKPEAKPFKRWVTHDILPTIAKTGRYEMTPASSATSAWSRKTGSLGSW